MDWDKFRVKTGDESAKFAKKIVPKIAVLLLVFWVSSVAIQTVLPRVPEVWLLFPAIMVVICLVKMFSASRTS